MSDSTELTALRVHPGDSVAIALRALDAGETVVIDALTVTTREPIPKGHKLALQTMAAGDNVTKYGWPIGHATRAIVVGQHVHTHNLETALRGPSALRFEPHATRPQLSPDSTTAFMGYLRENGRTGIRNEIWILPTVGCVARTAQKIAERARATVGGDVDGVYAFPHPFGCSQLGDDLAKTQDILAALASHPNVGGVVIVGLGCENNRLDQLVAKIDQPDDRLRSFSAQSVTDEVSAGVSAVVELAARCAKDKRVPRPLSALCVGLKCGGSDAFSGLTANPLVGVIATRVTAAGGTAVLTEIPETFGAEGPLLSRAQSAAVFEQAAGLINRFKQYFLDRGQSIAKNPSPGNLDGGITTLEEKSLGAVQKAGAARLTDVLAYGGRVRQPGLTLLEAPGNDAVSSTALAAAGAQVILFTTGRGTPLGFPAPTLKIASNSALAASKPGWIDFDAGVRLQGAALEPLADELLKRILAVASGQKTRAEQNDEREIAIWKDGVTL